MAKNGKRGGGSPALKGGKRTPSKGAPKGAPETFGIEGEGEGEGEEALTESVSASGARAPDPLGERPARPDPGYEPPCWRKQTAKQTGSGGGTLPRISAEYRATLADIDRIREAEGGEDDVLDELAAALAREVGC